MNNFYKSMKNKSRQIISIDTLQRGFPDDKSACERTLKYLSLVIKETKPQPPQTQTNGFNIILSADEDLELLKHSYTARWSVHW